VLTVLTDTSIKLDWTNAGEDYDGHLVERSTDGVTYAPIDTVAEGSNTFTDTGLTANTLYYYRVKAYIGTEYSSSTNIASDNTYKSFSQLLLEDDSWGYWNIENNPETVTVDGSNYVSQIDDLTGNGNHLIQATAAEQPVYYPEEGCISSPDTTNSISTGDRGLGTSATVYIVCSVPTSTANKFVLSPLSAASYYLYKPGSTTTFTYVTNGGNLIEANAILDTKVLIVMVIDGANSSLQQNSGTVNISSIASLTLNGIDLMAGAGYRSSLVKIYSVFVRSKADAYYERTVIKNALYNIHSLGITETAPRDIRRGILLVGDSNADGQGVISEIVGDDYKTVHTNNYQFKTNSFVAYDPNTSSRSSNRFCIENSLMQDLYDLDGKSTYLIKYGYGSTYVCNVDALDWSVASSGELYSTYIAMLTNAIKRCNLLNFQLRIKNLIIFSGSNDAQYPPTTETTFLTEIGNFVAAIQAVVTTLTGDTNILVHMPKVATGAPRSTEVNNAITTFCTNNGHNLIQYSNYTPDPAAIHWATAGIIECGQDLVTEIRP
jgi:hypothetical protein